MKQVVGLRMRGRNGIAVNNRGIAVDPASVEGWGERDVHRTRFPPVPPTLTSSSVAHSPE